VNHYVAHIKIEWVERPVIKKSTAYEPEMLGERQVTELVNVTIKGVDLADVKKRIAAATDQIEDF